jgi:hypothetical protein
MRRTAILSAILCLSIIPAFLIADGKRPRQSLNVTDLGTDFELIGRLGRPLGTMMTIKGTWGYRDQSKGPMKIHDLLFSITEIDGIPCKHPLILDVWSVHVIDKQKKSLIPPQEKHGDLDGVTWELRAYETGRHYSMPQEYYNFQGPIAMRQLPPFVSELVGYMPERK